MAKEEKNVAFTTLEAKTGDDTWTLSFEFERYNLKKNANLILSSVNLAECRDRAKENNIEFK